MFGLLHELCGEDGFGWSRRLMLLAPVMALPEDHPARNALAGMASRYGWSPEAARRAPERAAAVLELFAERLAAQHAEGRTFLLGDALSALDIYWAAFAALIEPLPEDVCPMPQAIRAGYASRHPALEAVMDPALLAHRDLVYERYLELPLDLGPAPAAGFAAG
jgi:glutathione S-transferase